jgi:hypothetical protein
MSGAQNLRGGRTVEQLLRSAVFYFFGKGRFFLTGMFLAWQNPQRIGGMGVPLSDETKRLKPQPACERRTFDEIESTVDNLRDGRRPDLGCRHRFRAN